MDQNDKSLIDELDKLQAARKDLEMREGELKKKIVTLAQQKNTNTLFGTHKTCSIKEYQKVSYPEDKDLLTKMLKEEKLYDFFSQINYSRLSAAITRKDASIPSKIFDQVKIQKDFKVTLLDRGI